MSFARFVRENAPFLIVGILLTFSSSFGQTFFISVFAGQIRDEFDLSNGDWGLIYSLGTTASAVVMIWSGVLTDTFRVRILGPAVIGLLSLSCLAMALVPGPITLALVVFALRFSGQGMAMLVATVAMARWFTRTRGKALSVAAVGVAAGESLLPVTYVFAMQTVDWRVLWVISAVILAAMAPMLWPLLKLERTPRSIAEDAGSLGMAGRNWTRGEMVRHPLFWCVIPQLIAPAAFNTAFFFHQVHLAETKSWTHLGLVALFPVFTVTNMIATFTAGPVIDRIGTGRLMPIVILPMAAGFAAFSFADTLVTTAICLGLMGLTQGLNSGVPNAFWAEFYGTRHMGGIRSFAAAILVFGTAIGPAVTGVLIDLGYPYEQQLAVIAVFFAAAAALTYIAIRRAGPSLAT